MLDLSRARSRHVGVTSLIRSNRPLLSLDLVNNLLSPPLITAAARERSNASAHASERRSSRGPSRGRAVSHDRGESVPTRSIDGYQPIIGEIFDRAAAPIHRESGLERKEIRGPVKSNVTSLLRTVAMTLLSSAAS